MPSIAATDEIEIEASPELVFDVVADYENIHTWLPVYECKILNGSEIKEGAEVSHRYGKPPFVMSEFRRVIDTIVTGQRLEERYIGGDLSGTGVWAFEPSAKGTLASYTCEVQSQTWFPHLTFALFGKNAHSNVYKPLLKKLKAHCESLS